MGLDRVTVFMEHRYHDKLMEKSCQRSAELGRKVSMGFVIQELLDRDDQITNPERHDPELFASHE